MRTLAYIFGSLLLLDGIPAIFSPHFWVRYSERNLAGYLPKPVLKTVTEFGSLSENAVRTKSLAEIMVGMMLFFMASMLSSLRPQFGMGMGMQGMEMSRHAHPHGHEGMRGEHSHPHGHWGHHEDEAGEGGDQEAL